MKRILLTFLCMLLSVSVYASFPTGTGGRAAIDGGGGVIVGGCDDCSGDLSLAYHCEQDDVTGGTPCGCSDGDSTATRNDFAVYDATIQTNGTSSLDAADKKKWAEFDNTEGGAESIAHDTAGTITFDLYITTFVAGGRPVQFRDALAGNADELRLFLFNDNDLQLSYYGNGVEVAVSSVAFNLALTTWYSVTIKWRLGAADPSLSLEANSVTTTSNTDLTAVEDAWIFLGFGEASGAESDTHVDNIKVYKTWQ